MFNDTESITPTDTNQVKNHVLERRLWLVDQTGALRGSGSEIASIPPNAVSPASVSSGCQKASSKSHKLTTKPL